MNLNHDTVIQTLNQLISVCKDQENNAREAAELVEDTRLKLMLRDCEQQFGEFVAELQAEERAYSLDPVSSGSVTAAVRRRRMALRYAVTRHGADHAVIQDCLRAEETVRRLYRKALEISFPSGLTDILRRQSLLADECFRRLRDTQTIFQPL